MLTKSIGKSPFPQLKLDLFEGGAGTSIGRSAQGVMSDWRIQV